MALDPAAPLLRKFKDLGVQKHAGAVGATAMAASVLATGARFERLAGLPLPHSKRARALAAAGVSAASYGATLVPPPPLLWAGFEPELRAPFGVVAGLEQLSSGSFSALSIAGPIPLLL